MEYALAIGFDESVLENICFIESAVPGNDSDSDALVFHLREIVYDPKDQVALLQDNVDLLVHFSDENKYGPAPDFLPKKKRRRGQSDKYFELENSNMFPLLVNFALDCFVVKSGFFMEEAEWRILALLEASSDGTHWAGCDFRPRSNLIVPYRKFPACGFNTNAITEIILGPGNNTPVRVVEALLRKHGFSNTKVSKSSGTYR